MLRILLPHCERSTRLILSSCGTSGVFHALAVAVIASLGGLSPRLFPPPQGPNSIQLTASTMISVEPAMDDGPTARPLAIAIQSPKSPPARIEDLAPVTSSKATAMISTAARRRETEPTPPLEARGGQVQRHAGIEQPLQIQTSVPTIASKSSSGQHQAIPTKIYSPRPDYPEEALQARIEGRVVLHVKVDSDGKVLSATILRSSGFESLDQAARRSVLKWRFESPRRFGQRIATEIKVPITFRIEE
jgi:protein TonB